MININRLIKKFNLQIIEETNINEEYLIFEAVGIESLIKNNKHDVAVIVVDEKGIEEQLEKISVIVLCEIKEMNEEIKKKFIKFNKPIIYSKFKMREIISIIDPYLLRKQQVPERVHGTLLSVFGEGVLITGASGIGKSELALELINRKHLFCGDDAIDVISFAGNPIGKAPRISRDFIEVRGVGIINVKGMFGVQSLIKELNIDLIIELVHLEDVKSSVDRLGKKYSEREINNTEIPLIQIPLSSGRSVASVVEAAVISFKQRVSENYIAANDFTERLKKSQ